MDKSNSGFTLPEVLFCLSIIGIFAVAVVPGMSAVLNTHALKVKVSRLDTYVDQARNLAAITECPVQMNLQPAQSAVNVSVQVELDPFLKGCTAWHSQTVDQNNRGFNAVLENVTLASVTGLRFSAVSGRLDAQNQTDLTLSYRDRIAQIRYQGIGNGVVKYE
ncbi:pilus assembly FimT family protein [Limnobacter parvus]|uniref:Prepilin-type N-terminal cleavage/methylation domain-containing protein n=1 Tax=Limnobacter parvus TaxID=2939690 RepID=A0ABT1XFA7_9BURK|nr:prepilin-type N-terminal cleavage/methylation domain-containing protein [Limnobacter parvus]MCR2745829.1 prepilin-type N-terminal cleavage/methylation domain-containing protein [Limnobacter parvus]